MACLRIEAFPETAASEMGRRGADLRAYLGIVASEKEKKVVVLAAMSAPAHQAGNNSVESEEARTRES